MSSTSMSVARQLYVPRPVNVEVDGRGLPRVVDAVEVEAIREDWLVEDRWWTGHPLHRHYYELVLVDGRSVPAFRDLRDGQWYRQQA